MQAYFPPEVLKKELDRCVKCGMCLPECPTYRLATDENESPRGRLALIEGLVNGQLAAEPALVAHLQNCLQCRRCERVCPSQVRFGALMDAGRGLLPDDPGPVSVQLLQSPQLLRWGSWLGRVMPAALSRPVPALHRLHRLARALPRSPVTPATGPTAARAGAPKGKVGLFAGCVTAVQQGGALNAATVLLRQAGYRVEYPDAAGCCGALAAHAGRPGEAEGLAGINRSAFSDDLEAIVSIASGCGIHLDAYDPPLPAPHQDICRFLSGHCAFRGDDFAPLQTPVLLHTPCSVENVYRGSAWARSLLSLIPGIEIGVLGEAGQCCGAAGDYMLRRPAIAARLRRPLLEQVVAAGGAIVLTSNVGCAMHLADGLRREGLGCEVLHPVELLARQLIQAPTATRAEGHEAGQGGRD